MNSASALEKEKPQSPPPNTLRLQVELLEAGGSSLGSYVTEGEDRFIIGSSKRADLVVPHESVSQIHAMLRLSSESDILLYDLGSEAGTFVDGHKIVERKLKTGEIFEIGGHRVRVNLLDQLSEDFHERSAFWKEDCKGAADRLELLRVESGIVRDERSVQPSSRLFFGRGRRELLINGTKPGECFLHRKDSGGSHSVEGRLPAGYVAEIYSGQNEVLRLIEQENSLFTFSEREKARLVSPCQDREILLYWQAQGVRTGRQTRDLESPVLRKTLASCLGLAAVVLLFISYLAWLKPETIEEATVPKSSYERLSMDSAPAPAQQSAQPAQGEGAAAKQEQQQQPSKATSISSSLSKLLNKKSAVTAEMIQQAISNKGTQSARDNNIKNPNIKSEAIASGAAGGSMNVNALSTGLSTGSGTKAGSLNGFAGGKGANIGSIGGNGFGGKGFDMSLGGDEAEALGGLDKSLIAAVVQANIGQIKHCYERQLIVDPNIFGKVIAQWTINKEGAVSVSSVKKTTMNNSAVENCIAAKIKGWVFPKPKGGGQVIVSYPFLFKSLN